MKKACLVFLIISSISILKAQENKIEPEFLVVSMSAKDTSLTYPFTKKYKNREVTGHAYDFMIYKVWQDTPSPTLFEEYIQINDTLFKYTEYDNSSDKIKRSGRLKISKTQYKRFANVTVVGLTPEEYPEKRYYTLEKTGYWREGSMSNRKGGQYINNKREGIWRQYWRGLQTREQIYKADSFVQEIQIDTDSFLQNKLYQFKNLQELATELQSEYNLELASGLIDNVVVFHPPPHIEIEPIDTVSKNNIIIVDDEEEEEEEIICSYYIVNMDLKADETIQLIYEPNYPERKKTFNGKLLFLSEMWLLIEFESNFVMLLKEL